MANIAKDKIFTKNTGIVLAAEIGSGLGAVLTAPVVDKAIHNAKIKTIIARAIEPHLTGLEKATGLTREIHAYHDALHTDADPHHAHGKPYAELTQKERAERVADTLINSSAAFIAENGISIGIQVLLKKMTGANISPLKTGLTGASVHLGFIGISATLASKPTEWVFHKIRDILPKITHMDKEAADKTARNITYVITPGLFAFLAETAVANPSHHK